MELTPSVSACCCIKISRSWILNYFELEQHFIKLKGWVSTGRDQKQKKQNMETIQASWWLEWSINENREWSFWAKGESCAWNIFFPFLKGLTIQFTVTDLETDFQDIFKIKCVVNNQIIKTDWLDFTFKQTEFQQTQS